MATSNEELSSKLTSTGAALRPAGLHHELTRWFDGASMSLAAMCGSAEEARKIFNCCLAAIVRNPRLMECTRESLQQCIRSTATLRLYPGPLQEVAFVPRRNKQGQWEANFEMQYQGLVKLAIQGGHCQDISAEVVYENDPLKYNLGTNPYVDHQRTLRGDPGKPIAVYAVAPLPNGANKVCIMTVAEVEKVRARSRAKDESAWTDSWDEMAKKTAIKRIQKTIPKNTQDVRLSDAIELDNASERPDLARMAPVIDVTETKLIEEAPAA